MKLLARRATRRARTTALAFVATTLLALGGAYAQAACPPAGMSTTSLRSLKAADWTVADDARRQALAIAMLDCLASPDPELRDDLAFEALAHWARGKQLETATLQSMRVRLLPQLPSGADDDAGFRRPFAALTLAEVARADRIQPFLSPSERTELVSAAAAFETSVRDYRGFDAHQGWRHGVAHGADLLLQLSLNPAVDRDALSTILGAIASQVMPAGEHFYLYGEGDRLMTPVFYIGRRDVFTTGEWSAWFAAIAARRDGKAAVTPSSLAATHNLNQFLLPLYVSLKEAGTPEMQARMLPGVTAALKTLD